MELWKKESQNATNLSSLYGMYPYKMLLAHKYMWMKCVEIVGISLFESTMHGTLTKVFFS